MSVIYKGTTTFVDQCVPFVSKNEFGMDTLTRIMKGASSGVNAYLGTLRQGISYQGFYLQSWNSDQGTSYTTVILNYKGLSNGIPNPRVSEGTSMQTVTISGDSPSEASRDIQFYADESTYRYITNTRPAGPSYSNTSTGRNPTIFSSVINAADGTIYKGSAPVALVTALTPATISMVTGHRAEPVYGTPWFECEDTVIRTFFGG